jgi:hypothetical protein
MSRYPSRALEGRAVSRFHLHRHIAPVRSSRLSGPCAQGGSRALEAGEVVGKAVLTMH